jgi:hypothetical protein
MSSFLNGQTHGFLTKFNFVKLKRGVTSSHLTRLRGDDEVTRHPVTSSSSEIQFFGGLDASLDLKRPDQHLGPENAQLSTRKKIYYCRRFFRKMLG